jgi:hypothetical protein
VGVFLRCSGHDNSIRRRESHAFKQHGKAVGENFKVAIADRDQGPHRLFGALLAADAVEATAMGVADVKNT